MFGLMKHADRLPYCGCCKTIGALYGQRARLALNHDMVFLAELLMDEPAWGPAHRSFNCLAMPKEHPPALRDAAAASVVLAHFQIEDQLADSGKWRWKAAKRFFSPSYRRAAADLRASGFALDEMTAVLGTQSAREVRASSLQDVSEPTARATEMVFAHGAAELASIGRRFGYLVYVLDAWEDRARDAKSGNFNALMAFPKVDGQKEILSTLTSLEKDLPPHLAVRLRANVEVRLGMRMRVVHGSRRKPSAERWRNAVEFARLMKQREKAGLLKGSAMLATVSVLAFLVPHPIRSAESWRQCFGLLMNLMAVGSVFATVPLPEAPPGAPEKKSGCWSSCGSCCCDSCDCSDCCDCCDCG